MLTLAPEGRRLVTLRRVGGVTVSARFCGGCEKARPRPARRIRAWRSSYCHARARRSESRFVKNVVRHLGASSTR